MTKKIITKKEVEYVAKLAKLEFMATPPTLNGSPAPEFGISTSITIIVLIL